MSAISIEIPREQVAELCQRWRIVRLSLFGSVVRDDFGPNSDVDVLIVFESDAPWDAWELLDLRGELSELFGRQVDLVEERSLHNPIRRRSILRDRQTIYAA